MVIRKERGKGPLRKGVQWGKVKISQDGKSQEGSDQVEGPADPEISSGFAPEQLVSRNLLKLLAARCI